MKILSRYIIKESIGPFFFGLSIITLVLVMDFLVDIMNLIISRGVKPFLVLELFALNLSWMLALSVPMAVLVAALMVFGRMASDNEITASRACGVSFLKLLLPMLGGAVVMTLAMIWFNDRVLPESNHKARMLMTDITRKKPTWSLEENIFLDHFEGYSIRVRTIARRTSEIADIIIIQTKNAERIITAKRGRMYFSPDGATLMLELEDGEILEVSEDELAFTRTDFKKQPISIPGASSELVRSSEGARGDREMSVSMMLAVNRDKHIQAVQYSARADSVTREAVLNLFPGQRDGADNIADDRPAALKKVSMVAKKIQAKQSFNARTAGNYLREINSMKVEIHKKFSIPAACVAFVLMGAPLGSIARKGGFTTGIALSLFFFIIYWSFLILGEQLADKGHLPAVWAMWMPNFIVGGAGILLSVAFVRQTAAISIIEAIKSVFIRGNHPARTK
jgi:lipopolysaccharide export system permease protein